MVNGTLRVAAVVDVLATSVRVEDPVNVVSNSFLTQYVSNENDASTEFQDVNLGITCSGDSDSLNHAFRPKLCIKQANPALLKVIGDGVLFPFWLQGYINLGFNDLAYINK